MDEPNGVNALQSGLAQCCSRIWRHLMAVDDVRVQRIINDALIMFGHASGCCAGVTAAFRYLQNQRRFPGGSVDEDLAAAEHYMFARQAVCTGHVSSAQMEAMVVGYETVKGIVRLFPPLERRMRTTPNPTAPASVASVRWGLQGVRDGQTQHDSCNRLATPPLFNREAYSYGSGYY